MEFLIAIIRSLLWKIGNNITKWERKYGLTYGRCKFRSVIILAMLPHKIVSITDNFVWCFGIQLMNNVRIVNMNGMRIIYVLLFDAVWILKLLLTTFCGHLFGLYSNVFFWLCLRLASFARLIHERSFMCMGHLFLFSLNQCWKLPWNDNTSTKTTIPKKNAKENKTYIPTACSQCMLMKTLVSNDQRAFWWVAFFSTSFIEYVCAFIILICARALVVFFLHFAETSQWKRFNDYVCISNVYTDVNGFFLFLLWWYVSFWVSALSLLEKSLPKKRWNQFSRSIVR